jgi:hypothetical protein
MASPCQVRLRISGIHPTGRRRTTEAREVTIEKGLNITQAVERLEALAQERKGLEQELAVIEASRSLNVHVQIICKEIVANLS